MSAENNSLYELATEAIANYIEIYLELSRQTSGFNLLQPLNLEGVEEKTVILRGINSLLDPISATAEEVFAEWQRVQALPFDTEKAITDGVYLKLRNTVETWLNDLEKDTNQFSDFQPEYIQSHPYMLPLFQRLIGVSSKAALKKQIGNVCDRTISKPASRKLAQMLDEKVANKTIDRGQILQSVEPTLEGIVRDLVGRVFLESLVANALDSAGVPYKSESESQPIDGVIYNFRADFVIPDDRSPQAFIEVRKSSSRHASLYAKDKMFSAINWKGKNKELLAVLVVDGDWTSQTLKAMARVFDYVLPIAKATEVAEIIAAYINGDKSKLKWLIDFSIKSSDDL
ncbi:MAG: hypothetical protein SXA11_22355 [Cyanobacteriota bacterium]|nr:hypothetical protein [Cyanobacteriota bacterium]